jgi:ATP-dependent DNA helicase PIF1
LKRSRGALTDLTNDPASPAPSRAADASRRKVRRVLLDQSPAKAVSMQPSQALTADQKCVLSLVARKKNVFFTGSAGTGKSFLLQHILRHVSLGRVYVTAPTGVAAYNVGGVTLHHFAGMTTRPYASQRELLAEIQRKADAVARWKTVQTLIVDEVSMLDGKLFSDLDFVARALRRNQAAFFGGIQLILSGDFFQLPPVSKQHTTLCFESEAWRESVEEVVVLRDVFRQKNAEFVEILNAFRTGSPTRAMIEKVNARFRRTDSDEDEDAIRIFTHNDDVLQVRSASMLDESCLLFVVSHRRRARIMCQTNTKRLADLPGKKFNFIAADRCVRSTCQH